MTDNYLKDFDPAKLKDMTTWIAAESEYRTWRGHVVMLSVHRPVTRWRRVKAWLGFLEAGDWRVMDGGKPSRRSIIGSGEGRA
jgi:hypothetical protein